VYLAREDLSNEKTLERMYEEGLFLPNINAAYTERPEDLTYLKGIENQIKNKLSLSAEEKNALFT